VPVISDAGAPDRRVSEASAPPEAADAPGDSTDGADSAD
jgi:hypothetical protein